MSYSRRGYSLGEVKGFVHKLGLSVMKASFLFIRTSIEAWSKKAIVPKTILNFFEVWLNI